MPIWLLLATALGTAIVIGMFSNRISKIESAITDKFSELTSKPRWFTIWVLVFVLWVCIHKLLLGKVSWYSEDVDLIIVTGLFSAVPYWVENSLKHSQAKFQILLLQTIDHLTELTVAVKEALDKAEDRDIEFKAEQEALYMLFKKLVNTLEEVMPEDDRQMERTDCSDHECQAPPHLN